MPRELKISVGQFSDKGVKETNQDFHGVLIPDEPLLSLKGISIVLADGMRVAGAELKNGLLAIDLERPEPERLVRKINISVKD